MERVKKQPNIEKRAEEYVKDLRVGYIVSMLGRKIYPRDIFLAGAQAALTLEAERTKILVEALEYYANDPAFDEKSYEMISSNFRSNNCAKDALQKYRGRDDG